MWGAILARLPRKLAGQEGLRGKAPMLNLYQSNNLVALAELWRATRNAARQDPLTPETLLVPSMGMQRWLMLWIAQKDGIAGNLDFHLAGSFVWQLLRRVNPALPKRAATDADPLVWRIMARLPDVLEKFPAASIAPGWRLADPAGRYQLSWRLADVFDQYQMFRGDWLGAWDRGWSVGLGGGEDWQAELWRSVTAGEPHRARLLQELGRRVQGGDIKGLPERLCVFGISSLPPVYWDMLQLLGERTEVDFFLLNPSREYWGQLKRGEPDQHLLLASLGQQGRDFISRVISSGVVEPVGNHAFVENQQPSLLACLQNDILDQRLRSPDTRMTLEPADSSLRIHVCHSTLREVEVLHDQLVNWFDTAPDLLPHEVLVMVSDIKRYAPLIDAVFGSRQHPALPYTIADRQLLLDEPLLARFDELLALPESHFELMLILGFLNEPAIRERFGIAEADAAELAGWCEAACIRWGRDDEERRQRGLPPAPFSWRQGLDRLLLGFLMPPGLAATGNCVWRGLAPEPHAAQVSQAQTLARFSLLLETLLQWDRRLRRSRSLTDWADALQSLLDALFAETPSSSAALQHLRDVIAELREQARLSGDTGLYACGVIRAWSKRQIGSMEARRGFLHGAITFCAMVPMRSLPFKAIAVLGLDEGVFPRHQRPWSFDLMGCFPRAGDRSRRLDDRYLFLETLLAASHRLHLSYCGRSDLDDSPRSPSPVLQELVEQIRDTACVADDVSGEKLLQQLVVTHALQPFNPRYFSGNANYPSYAPRFFAASQLLLRGTTPDGADEAAPISPVAPPLEIINLADIESFFSHPQAYFFRTVMGIDLNVGKQQAESTEPLDADNRSLPKFLLLGDENAARAAGALGLVPAGAWGETLLQEKENELAELRDQLRPALAGMLRPQDFSVALGRWHWRGRLGQLTAEGRVEWSFKAQPYASSLLVFWLRHLLLCYLRPEGVAPESRYFCLRKVIHLPPVENPETHLLAMAHAFECGCHEPLPLFRRASPAFVKAGVVDGKVEVAFWGNNFATGDMHDMWVEKAFAGQSPLDARFMTLAEEIYGPLGEWL